VRVGKVLTVLMGNILTAGVGKVLDIYNLVQVAPWLATGRNACLAEGVIRGTGLFSPESDYGLRSEINFLIPNPVISGLRQPISFSQKALSP